jgi:hypothetical protein
MVFWTMPKTPNPSLPKKRAQKMELANANACDVTVPMSDQAVPRASREATDAPESLRATTGSLSRGLMKPAARVNNGDTSPVFHKGNRVLEVYSF